MSLFSQKFLFRDFKNDMIRYKVFPSAVFSHSIIKGSPAERMQKLYTLNNRLYSGIKENLVNTGRNSIDIETLRNIIYSVFPEKKHFSIVKIPKNLTQEMEASADYLFDSHDNIVGHIVEIPLKKKCFAMTDIPTLMHEMTHVFEKMFNPKIMKRSAALSYRLENGIGHQVNFNKYNNLYDRLYPIDYEVFTTQAEKTEILKSHREEILKFVRGKSLEEKLDILQNLRYQLGMELNAYQLENEFIDKMTPKGEDLSSLKVQVDKYLFKEKIDILKELTFNIIKKERNKIRINVMKRRLQDKS